MIRYAIGTVFAALVLATSAQAAPKQCAPDDPFCTNIRKPIVIDKAPLARNFCAPDDPLCNN